METLHTVSKKSRLTREAAARHAEASPCCSPAEASPCGACVTAAPAVDPWDIEGPAEGWPEDTDQDVWQLGVELAEDVDPEMGPSVFQPIPDVIEPSGPSAEDEAEYREYRRESDVRDHLDRSATLTLDALVDHVAGHFRTWGNGGGDLIARTLEELATKIRIVDAETPADYEARIAILDEDIRADWEAIGYEAACAQFVAPVGSTFGHHA